MSVQMQHLMHMLSQLYHYTIHNQLGHRNPLRMPTHFRSAEMVHVRVLTQAVPQIGPETPVPEHTVDALHADLNDLIHHQL